MPDGYVALAVPRANPERLREDLRAGVVARFVTPGERLTQRRHAAPGAADVTKDVKCRHR